MRAWRRETFASGSSESRSTSGKIPPSASHRPMFDSAELSMNCLPTDLPRSMTSFACGLSLAPREEERFTAGPPSLPAATSGCGISAGECEPLFPSGSTLKMFMPEGFGPDPDDELGRSGAPHSSQYCPPSRFEDLHLSHVIMIFRGFATRTQSAIN